MKYIMIVFILSFCNSLSAQSIKYDESTLESTHIGGLMLSYGQDTTIVSFTLSVRVKDRFLTEQCIGQINCKARSYLYKAEKGDLVFIDRLKIRLSDGTETYLRPIKINLK